MVFAVWGCCEFRAFRLFGQLGSAWFRAATVQGFWGASGFECLGPLGSSV